MEIYNYREQVSRIFKILVLVYGGTGEPVVLSPLPEPLQMHGLRLPAPRGCLTCHSVVSWRREYSVVPELENLD